MHRTLEIILASRMVAILRLDNLTHAADISQALLEAGVVAQEFTLTNPDALTALGEVIKQIPAFGDGSATIGIGSVRTPAQAVAAIEAGTQFLVTPILSPGVIREGQTSDVPVLSGAFSPTEIFQAWELGASIVKVFPARGLGPNYIKDVLAPMPELKLMPTGGIDVANMGAYFEAGAAAVGIGGNLLSNADVTAGNWEAISEAAREFVQAAKPKSRERSTD